MRFVDQNLGRTASSCRKGHLGGSGACKGTSHEERKERAVAILRSSSPKAMRRPVSWQKEHCWTKGLWRKQERKLCSRKEEVCAALQYAASFHCQVEEWKDCDELKPKPKDKLISVDQKKEETKHRTEW